MNKEYVNNTEEKKQRKINQDKMNNNNNNSESNAAGENKMGIMPVNRLLLSMSLPMMISMLVQAAYNVVDSIFVAKVSENALTAVSLAFPIQSLLIAVGAGTGVGMNAVLSKALGEKNVDKANKTAVNGVFLAVIGYILFVLIGILAVKPFYSFQLAGGKMTEAVRQEIYHYGVDYLTICCVCSVGVLVQMTFERLLQSTGKTMLSMFTQLAGAIVNILLDPILIFGLLGFPRMEAAGAAVATVVGQTVAAVMGIVLHILFNKEIHISLKGFKPDFSIIRKVYSVGIPSIIMQAIGSVMVFGMNKILMVFSSTAAAVFGVYFKLQSFVFMPVFGLNNGMVPIIAFNYGAGKRERLVKTIKLSILYAVAIMLAGFAVLQIFPVPLLKLFDASDNMLDIGVTALRTISYSFVFAGYCIVAGSVFQALGNGMYSLLVSVLRQMLVLVPVAYLFGRWFGLEQVWLAFPIAELMSLAASTVFLVRIYKKVIRHIGADVQKEQ